MKQIYIISGPNGAGKSTSAETLLPTFLLVNEFINADSIAKTLSDYNASLVSVEVNVEAGKIMLNRIKYLMSKEESFAFETTLASKTFVQYITKAKKLDYEINLIFLWIKDVDFAKERVKIRVEQKGHGIPEKDVERRYQRGLKNLFETYWNIVDNIFIYNSNVNPPEIIFEKKKNNSIIYNQDVWNKIKKDYGI